MGEFIGSVSWGSRKSAPPPNIEGTAAEEMIPRLKRLTADCPQLPPSHILRDELLGVEPELLA